jgi:hypothetical protein
VVKNQTSRTRLKIVPIRKAIANVGRSIIKIYTPPAANTARRISRKIKPPAVIDNSTSVLDFMPLIAPAIHSNVRIRLSRQPIANPFPGATPPK